MSAMLKGTLSDYPIWIACAWAVGVVLMYSVLTFWVFRKKVKPGLEYASRLPLEK